MDEKKISVFLIEDNPADARLIKEQLKMTKGVLFDVKQAGKLDGALKLLRQETFDIILLDLDLPDSQGLETVKSVMHHEPDVPIVVLSGLHDEAMALEAVRLGAEDFLEKGRTIGGTLERTIRYAIERKRAGKALLAASDLWHATFNAVRDAVCLLDPEGKILQCNKAFEVFVNKPAEKIVGCHCYELVHAASAPIPNCPLVRMLKSHQREELEMPAADKWFYVVVDPIFDKSGMLTRIVHVMHDITEHKRSEEELKDRIHDLEIFRKVSVGRELKMMELKEHIKKLEAKEREALG